LVFKGAGFDFFLPNSNDVGALPFAVFAKGGSALLYTL